MSKKDRSLNIKREDFNHLSNQPIKRQEAARKYNIRANLLLKWAKDGYISILSTHGRAWSFDERDVAYCAAVYHAKKEFYDGTTRGVQFFDKDGNPYRTTYTELAERKRRERRGESVPQPSVNDPSLSITREDFNHLDGLLITYKEAVQKYKINQQFLSEARKRGVLHLIGRHGRYMMFNERDVAYCAAVYHAKKEFYGGSTRGVRFFDKDGNPYKPKNPEAAAIERKKRRFPPKK